MDIQLTETQTRDLIQHAISGAPYEVCGLLAGAENCVHRVIPIKNVAVNPQHNYAMNPIDFVKAIYEIEAANLALLGIYHSHPDGDSIPSPMDIRQAHYPDVAYLIIGLKSAIPYLGAWQIRYHQVESVGLHIGTRFVSVEESDVPLSVAQKRAIVVSAGLAFVIMLILSLALLPPVTVSSLSIH